MQTGLGGRGRAAVPASALLVALSQAFSYPAKGLAATLRPMEKLTVEEKGGHDRRIAHVLASSKHFANLMDEQLAYTRLFIGSLKMEAPPYASFYLDEGHLMNGQHAVEVAAVYRQFGIRLGEKEASPPDHLRYLLAFCALLAKRYEETGEDAFAESYADFRDTYILSWVGECRKLVNRNAEKPYYPELIALVVDVLEAGAPQ